MLVVHCGGPWTGGQRNVPTQTALPPQNLIFSPLASTNGLELNLKEF